MLDNLRLLAAKVDPGVVGVPRVDPGSAINGILGAVYFWAGAVAVLTIVVAGFKYVRSQGDAGKIKAAKDMIVGAIIGLGVVLTAYIITRFVLGQLG